MKSSQLIKIDSISSGDSDKKKNCRRAIIKRCTGAVEAFWKRKANPNRILYVKRIVGTHKEIHTSHIIVKNGGNGSNTLFQFTHTPKKTFFSRLFENQFILFYIHTWNCIRSHTHSERYERSEKGTHSTLYNIIHFRIPYTDHRNETKKSGKFRTKKCYRQKKLCVRAKERDTRVKNVAAIFVCLAIWCHTKLWNRQTATQKKTRLYVYSHTRPCMREYVQQIDCGGGATGPKISL